MTSKQPLSWSPTHTYHSRRVEIAEAFFKVRENILKQYPELTQNSNLSPQKRERLASVAFMNDRSLKGEQHDNLIYALSAFASQGLKSNERAFHLLTIKKDYAYEMLSAGLKNLDQQMFSSLQENPLSPRRQKGGTFRRMSEFFRSTMTGRGGR